MSKNKQELDELASEAFSVDDIEAYTDLGFNPADVINGDAEAIAKFLRLHAAAMGKE